MSVSLKLPKTVWSQLGPVSVALVPFTDPDKMGGYDPHQRTITVNAAMCHDAQLQTVYHEAAHCWLADGGVDLGAMEEVVVDLIASAIVNLLQEQPRARRR